MTAPKHHASGPSGSTRYAPLGERVRQWILSKPVRRPGISKLCGIDLDPAIPGHPTVEYKFGRLITVFDLDPLQVPCASVALLQDPDMGQFPDILPIAEMDISMPTFTIVIIRVLDGSGRRAAARAAQLQENRAVGSPVFTSPVLMAIL